MTSAIDNAISRLQALALQISSITIKHAPAYPVEDAGVLPLSIAHLSSGRMVGGEATSNIQVHIARVDFHVSRVSMRQAYAELDSIVPEYMNLLAGDPTLNGAIDTININEVTYTVGPAVWDKITTQAAFFSIPFKIFSTPQASS